VPPIKPFDGTLKADRPATKTVADDAGRSATDAPQKGPRLHSGQGVANVADGVDPRTQADEEAAKKAAAEAKAQREYEAAVRRLTRAAAREVYEAHLIGLDAPPPGGAVEELEKVRAELVAHGHADEAEALGERLAAELENLLENAGTPIDVMPMAPPPPPGPPPELVALAHRAADEVRPMLATGRARREGSARELRFYFPRDDQPYSLRQLVAEINRLGHGGEMGWAVRLQTEFLERLNR
jgi:hypothetical protein